MQKDLTKITDLSKEEILEIIDLAFQLKSTPVPLSKPLAGKVIAMIFEKPSLRTKVAFEVAATHLGATPIFLTSGQILASGNNEKGRESIPDIAKNLERYSDLIMARVYHHEAIEKIANSIEIPVINALCDKHHPTQALADIMTIVWHKGKLDNLKVSFIGDGNNVSTSLMHICAILGIDFAIASPEGFEIPTDEYKTAIKNAQKSHSTIEFHTKPEKAIQDADVVYTDTFISMGEEEQKEEKLEKFQNYQLTLNLLKNAKENAIFMHCLPAHRGEEVTDEVMDCPQSVIFDQAECRMHIAKSLLITYLTQKSCYKTQPIIKK